MRKRANLSGETNEAPDLLEQVSLRMADHMANGVPTVASLLSELDMAEKSKLGIQCGYLDKKNSSLALWLCPSLTKCLPLWLINMFGLQPWKRRYFVLVGNFLYRFTDDQADTIKGTPIPIQATNPILLPNPDDKDGSQSEASSNTSAGYEPEDSPHCILLSSIRKNVTIRASSRVSVIELTEVSRATQTRKNPLTLSFTCRSLHIYKFIYNNYFNT